jgi:hypothetical protein
MRLYFFLKGVFMKKALILLTLLSLALGLVLVGCKTVSDGAETISDDDGDPKAIVITGYNDSLKFTNNGGYLFSESTGIVDPYVACGLEKITGQTITYNFGTVDFAQVEDWDKFWDYLKPWKGTGKLFFVINCATPKAGGWGATYAYSVDGKTPALVDIKDTVTMLEWSKFIYLKDWKGG